MNNDALIEKLYKLIEPIVVNKGYELYHIEYVKEAGENYLRIYIDSDSGISLEDCENVSRPVSDLLDIEDPIVDSYYLEVSSPGIDRILYNDNHLKKYFGETVSIKLSKLHYGKKQYDGDLADFNSEEIFINVDNEKIGIPREKIKTVSLKGEL